MTLPQRLIALVVVAAALATFVVAYLAGDNDPEGTLLTGAEGVERLIPEPNAEVLRQNPVGIDLEEGFAAELFVNGNRIPAEQLNRFRNPDDPREANEASATNADTGLSLFLFQPQEDHIIASLDGDENCARAIYWPVADPTDRRTVEWCFTAA